MRIKCRVTGVIWMLIFLPLELIVEISTWKDQRLNESKEILA